VLNVQEKENKTAAPPLTEAQHRFIDDLAQTYARYGVSLTFGRLFGLLLVSDGPVSLDDIASQLLISKSGASVTARELERSGVVRRLATPRSRRIMYEATDNMEATFGAQIARVRDAMGVFKRAEKDLTEGRSGERIRRILDLHEFWIEETHDIVDRWHRRRTQ
jgi:DNA-binding transcriptional regulator GbsR (MarR family)